MDEFEMNDKERAAMQQALEALKYDTRPHEAIIALDEALADPDIETMTLTQIAAKNEQAEQEPVRLRRGDVLRCKETDELCLVWTLSTTGDTLIKWGPNDFGHYTAQQIGDLFWIEPKIVDEPVAWVDSNDLDDLCEHLSFVTVSGKQTSVFNTPLFLASQKGEEP